MASLPFFNFKVLLLSLFILDTYCFIVHSLARYAANHETAIAKVNK